MKNSGGGSIVNVSSLGGLVGYPLLSAYCASKWGQIGFTKACAEEGKKDKILVNAIAPGKADTAIRSKIKEDKSKMLTPEDQVDACVFLASDEVQIHNRAGYFFRMVWGRKVTKETSAKINSIL